jgi:hypothetical protein
MLTLQMVEEIGHLFPISTDPDFRQEAHLIRLMTKSQKGARKAWKEACRRYGYSDQIQPIPTKEDKTGDLITLNRRAFFKPATYRRKKFWDSLEEVLLPDELSTLWNWARQDEAKITTMVQDVIDTVIVMTMPVL